jgi:hypothetical protein
MIRCAAILLVCGGPLPAQELRTPGEEVLEEIYAARALNDEAALARSLREAGEIHRYPASEREARKLLEAVLPSLKARADQVVIAALDALTRMAAEETGREIEPFLRSFKPELSVLPRYLAALRAAAAVRAPVLVAPLLNVARKCEDITVAGQAWMALSSYHAAPVALRKQVVSKMIEAASALSRGQGRARRARWFAMRPPALRALQLLVGRKLNSVDQFSDWWKIAKTQKNPWR